jgi:hypothetical protein
MQSEFRIESQFDKEAHNMASNELEVLDPAAPVEKVEEHTASRVLNRRNLMAGFGIAGAAIGAGLVSRRSVKRPSVVEASSFAATFTQTDYLNYLLNIKYLQATLYSFLTQGADIPVQYTVNGTLVRPTYGTFPVNNYPSTAGNAGAAGAATNFNTLPVNGAQITDMLNEIYYDELNQLINLQSLIGTLGTIAITRPSLDLLGTGTVATTGVSSPTSITAKTTAGSPVITPTSLSGLIAGQVVSGPGIPNGTTILSVGSSTVTLSANATATAAAASLTWVTSSGFTITTTTAYTPKVALGVLRILEDVAVTAFAGVAEFLSGSNLTAASQIFAVDGQHAGAIRLAIILQNNATANTVPDLLADSDINPENGNFYSVQADDVAPVDPLSASVAASGPIVATTPVLTSSQEQLASGCTAPFPPVPGTSPSITGCTPTQYQAFFATTGSKTASSSSPPISGFAFARTTSQVLSILYGKLSTTTGITPASPALPSTAVPPISAVVSSGGFFPQGFGGQINII